MEALLRGEKKIQLRQFLIAPESWMHKSIRCNFYRVLVQLFAVCLPFISLSACLFNNYFAVCHCTVLKDSRPVLHFRACTPPHRNAVICVSTANYTFTSWTLCTFMQATPFLALNAEFRKVLVSLSGQSSWLQIRRSRVRFPGTTREKKSSGSGTGSTQPREYN
jgi:hypothetical protein